MTEVAKAPPAFQFYASDTMADRRYRYMSFAERGLLLSLLCECWVNRSAPSDLNSLSKLLGFTKDEVEQALTEEVLSFFKNEKGELINTGLAEYRQRLDDGRANMSKGGKRGANSRWHKGATDTLNHLNSHPIDPPNGDLMGSRAETSRAETSRRDKKELDAPCVDPWVTEYDTHTKDRDTGNVQF